MNPKMSKSDDEQQRGNVRETVEELLSAGSKAIIAAQTAAGKKTG